MLKIYFLAPLLEATLSAQAQTGGVGIGTTRPIAKLHASGSGTSYFFATSTLQGSQGPGSGARAAAAYFIGGQVWVNDLIVAGALNTTSDRRIKHVLGLAAGAALLNQLRITGYTYIGQVNSVPGVIKKVIAPKPRWPSPRLPSKPSRPPALAGGGH